MKTNRLYNI